MTRQFRICSSRMTLLFLYLFYGRFGRVEMIVFNFLLWSDAAILSKALLDYNEFPYETNSPSRMRQEQHVVTSSTSPTLSPEMVLLYVDAGLVPNARNTSIAILALKANGQMLHAYGSPIHFVGKAVIAEALAIRKAIQIEVEQGWRNLQICLTHQ
ncbi:uncharacterized protein LOC124898175 [Capsicum annuum]|uniref:uncharacterized protein LOC124898175 n=1 Tax=Capsicum annuum TaxID=4072 RepID=UPI001FB07F11|nr:uncharacterized protein LOC124898175 [Capsicum annuum]